MKKGVNLYNIEIEKVILSSMLLKADALNSALQKLKPVDFYDSAHGFIFSVIADIAQTGTAPDMPLVSSALKQRGAGDRIIAAFIELVNIPASFNYMEMINEISEHSRKRDILFKLQKVSETIATPLSNSDKILAELSFIIRDFQQSPADSQLIISAGDLLNQEFAEPKWIIEGIIPEGVTLLTSPPKIGKSWFVLDTVMSLSLGVPVLGKNTSAVNTLYLALEDNPRRLKSRIQRQSVGDIKQARCSLTTQWKPGTEGLLQLHNYVKAENPGIIAIDTLGVFSKIKDSGDYYENGDVMTGFKNLSHDCGVSLVIVHHTRKQQAGASEGDFLERTLGSQAIAGGADSVISITKKRNTEDAILSITGRDVEEQELAVKFNKVNCRWELLGKSHEVADSAQRQEIINLIKDEGSLTPAEIAKHLGKSGSTVRTLLSKMLEAGNLKKQEISGRYKINDELF